MKRVPPIRSPRRSVDGVLGPDFIGSIANIVFMSEHQPSTSIPSTATGVSTPTEDTICTARFDADAILRYYYCSLIPVCLFIVTIPIVVIVAIAYWFILRRVIASWSATLTPKSLLVKKGVFNKVEKTIPLEKITDLSSVEGPIMRFAGIKRLGIETAGQSGAAGGSLVSLLGVVDSDAFRAQVLAQRDAGAASASIGDANTAGQSNPAITTDGATLVEIRDALGGIAHDLRRVADRLDQRS